MKTLNKYVSRTLCITAIGLSAVLAGCNNDNNTTKPIVPPVVTDPVATIPTVTSTEPTNEANDVEVNSIVIANFSETMSDATINTLSFTLVGQDEPALTGTVSYDANSNSASFTSDTNFSAGTVYTATITTEAQSSESVPLAENVVWRFTSGSLPDNIAPTVSLLTPEDNAIGFALNHSITAFFSEELAPASVNINSFTLSSAAGAVTGTVSYDNKLLAFKPTSDLTANTLYTATLTTEITDIQGNALETNLVWHFSTDTEVAMGPNPVNLRMAGDFVILTKTGITNVPNSVITGNIGASPITAAAMDNVFCPEINGTIFGADAAYTGSGNVTCFAGSASDNTLVANAVLDMGTAYNDAAGRTTPNFTELHAGDISGQTLVPGLYKWGTNVLINTDVSLSGGANDIWIFQIAGDVIQASSTNVFLTGGALAKNVYWQVAGGTGVVLDTGAHFEGIVLAEKGIAVRTGATVNGRLLSKTAVTLDQNTVTQPTP